MFAVSTLLISLCPLNVQAAQYRGACNSSDYRCEQSEDEIIVYSKSQRRNEIEDPAPFRGSCNPSNDRCNENEDVYSKLNPHRRRVPIRRVSPPPKKGQGYTPPNNGGPDSEHGAGTR